MEDRKSRVTDFDNNSKVEATEQTKRSSSGRSKRTKQRKDSVKHTDGKTTNDKANIESGEIRDHKPRKTDNVNNSSGGVTEQIKGPSNDTSTRTQSKNHDETGQTKDSVKDTDDKTTVDKTMDDKATIASGEIRDHKPRETDNVNNSSGGVTEQKKGPSNDTSTRTQPKNHDETGQKKDSVKHTVDKITDDNATIESGEMRDHKPRGTDIVKNSNGGVTEVTKGSSNDMSTRIQPNNRDETGQKKDSVKDTDDKTTDDKTIDDNATIASGEISDHKPRETDNVNNSIGGVTEQKKGPSNDMSTRTQPKNCDETGQKKDSVKHTDDKTKIGSGEIRDHKPRRTNNENNISGSVSEHTNRPTNDMSTRKQPKNCDEMGQKNNSVKHKDDKTKIGTDAKEGHKPRGTDNYNNSSGGVNDQMNRSINDMSTREHPMNYDETWHKQNSVKHTDDKTTIESGEVRDHNPRGTDNDNIRSGGITEQIKLSSNAIGTRTQPKNEAETGQKKDSVKHTDNKIKIGEIGDYKHREIDNDNNSSGGGTEQQKRPSNDMSTRTQPKNPDETGPTGTREDNPPGYNVRVRAPFIVQGKFNVEGKNINCDIL